MANVFFDGMNDKKLKATNRLPQTVVVVMTKISL